jgi:tRNA-dihydrouridine synthase B
MRGAGLVHTEMVSAAGLLHENRKTRGLLEGPAAERPLVLQLFGPEAGILRAGAEAALDVRSFEALEVNFACPMPKIAGKGSGAALLERPDEAARIVAALIPLGLPVWGKLRICSPGSVSTESLCGGLLNAGASFLIVHGRTRAQRYEGRADREAVGALARIFPGRIGASGDVYDTSDVRDYLARGAEAVLVARGFLRNPFILEEAAAFLAGRPEPLFSLAERARALGELGEGLRDCEGEQAALVLVKKFLVATLRGFHGAAELRDRGVTARTWSELSALLKGPEERFFPLRSRFSQGAPGPTCPIARTAP